MKFSLNAQTKPSANWQVALVAVALALASGCHPKAPADAAGDEKAPPVYVHLTTVASRPIVDRLAAPGTVVLLPGRGAEVHAATSGRVISLDVRLGQNVRTGQSLVHLQQDPTPHADAVKSGLALTQAKQEARRQERLYAAGVAAKQALEQARSALATAEADYEARHIADRQANANARPVSPLTGIVTQVGVLVGGIADPATALVTIANLAKVGLQAEVPSAQLGHLTAGMQGFVKGPDGDRVHARIIQVDPAVDPQTQRGKVLAEVDNGAGRIKLSMFATLELRLGEHRGISVPAVSVVDRAGHQVVYVVKAGIAKERPVELGPTADAVTEIVSGLTEGETVVTEGAYQLTDGVNVTTVEPKTAAPEAADAPGAEASGADEKATTPDKPAEGERGATSQKPAAETKPQAAPGATKSIAP